MATLGEHLIKDLQQNSEEELRSTITVLKLIAAPARLSFLQGIQIVLRIVKSPFSSLASPLAWRCQPGPGKGPLPPLEGSIMPT